MRYIPVHFKSQELLPPDIYKMYGDGGLAIMDERILWTLDRIRNWYNRPITVNNWKDGGPFSQRGFRNDAGTGALLSAHRFGRAVDFDVEGVPAEEFRTVVKAGAMAEVLKYVTRIEDKVRWIHVDCVGLPRTGVEDILFFKP